jgi:drug/metabolite transporter (DMT)-like permease
MTSMSWFALGMAVFGAFSYAVGSILQAVGAKRSHSTASTLGHPLYLIGIVFDIVAWIGAIVALQHLAVYVVESVLAGSLAVTAVAAWLFLGSRLRGRDVAAIVCTTGALGVLALSAGRQHEMLPSTQVRIGLASALVLLWVLGYGATKTGRPGLIAVIGGFSLGGAAISGRALQFPEEEMREFTTGAIAVVSEPVLWTMIAFALTGMLLYASALQGGEVGRVTAVHWTGEVVLPSIIALTLIGDTVRPGWELPALAAGLVTVGSAIVLASAPAAVAPAGDDPVPAHLQAGAVVVPPPRAGALFPAEAWRLSIPAEAYWPALQPPLVRGYGSFVWFGSATTPQPLWIPPDRTLSPPNAIPAWAGPQLPESRNAPATGAQPALRRPRRLSGPRHAALPPSRRSGSSAA